MLNVKETFVLKARHNFQCTGSKCSRNCCNDGWFLTVDSDVLEKWNTQTKNEAKQWLLEGISEKKFNSEFLINTKHGKHCHFLDENNLCEIQIRYDHELLPAVCREFPRVNFGSAYREYQTAMFSCPEIVKAVLFEGINEPPYKKMHSETVRGPREENAVVDTDLDRLVNDVLDLDKFPLGVKIFYISHVFGQLYNKPEPIRISQQQILPYLKNYKQNLFEINLAFKQGKLKPDPVTAGSFWRVIYLLCKSREIDTAFLESESAPFTSTLTNCAESHDDYAKIYEIIRQYSKAARPVLRQKYGKLLQVFIKVYFGSKGFPITSSSVGTTTLLVECLAGICMLQLLLWMRIHQEADVTDDFLAKVIVEVSRKYVHSSAVAKRLEEDPHMLQVIRYCHSFLDLF